MKLVLIGRNSIATLGADLELMCRVRGPRIPMTLSWIVQRDESLDNILTMYSDGSISWSGEQQRYQLRVQKSQNELIHYLAINGVGHREAGRYQCSAVVSLKNGPKKLTPSNTVAVTVQDPGSASIFRVCHLLNSTVPPFSFGSHHIKPCLLPL